MRRSARLFDIETERQNILFAKYCGALTRCERGYGSPVAVTAAWDAFLCRYLPDAEQRETIPLPAAARKLEARA